MFDNLKLRVISGTIAFFVVLLAILVSETIFVALTFLLAALLFAEWHDIAHKYNKLWHGYVLLLPALISALLIRGMDSGEYLLLLALFLIVAVDVGGYFGGKYFGGKKLYAKVSPKKTVSGLICGIVSALVIVHIVIASISDQLSFALPGAGLITFLVIIFAVLEQGGDLLASYFKRQFHVKDSGHLIPGHGGVLDRCDGIILVLPIMYLMIIICL